MKEQIEARQDEQIEERQDGSVEARRSFLKKAGMFAIYTPPVMMMLMHPSRNAIARTLGKGNNGVGNGIDPPPNGRPFHDGTFNFQNDDPPYSPGNPGYRGGDFK